MTLTLEEAAEKAWAGAREDYPDGSTPRAWFLLHVNAALKSYGDQRFIEGATAMREMAANEAYQYLSGDEFDSRYCDSMAAAKIRTLDPNQLKDTDHG